jgi:hypothetical protein
MLQAKAATDLERALSDVILRQDKMLIQLMSFLILAGVSTPLIVSAAHGVVMLSSAKIERRLLAIIERLHKSQA